MSARLRGVVAAGLLVATSTLTGCGGTQPDTAAIVDGQVIRESDVQQAAAQITDAVRATPDGAARPAITPVQVLYVLIKAGPLLEYAGQNGVASSESIARRALSAVHDPSPATLRAMEANFADQGLYSLAQSDPQLKQDVDAALARMKVSVNPRYGTWDSANATILSEKPNWLVVPTQ